LEAWPFLSLAWQTRGGTKYGILVFNVEHEVELRESQGLRLRELSKAEKLAEENKKLIIEKWHEHLD
jgi:hypothetical protein